MLSKLVLLSAGVSLCVRMNDITWYGYNAFLIDCNDINNGFLTIGIITLSGYLTPDLHRGVMLGEG